jgi:hypothetical protein
MPATPADAVDPHHAAPRPSPVVVAMAGWLVPGAGYWVLGQRARALIVGITIIILFTAGTLIGGVRSIQVPGYGENGGRLYTWYELAPDGGRATGLTRVSDTKPEPEPPAYNFRKAAQGPWVATDFRSLLAEVGNKPWSICQIMAGPLAIGGGAASVWASRAPDAGTPAPGSLSHSRVNEIAVLYTAVAGMLNLLVVIDAAGRAAHRERTAAHASGAVPAAAGAAA